MKKLFLFASLPAALFLSLVPLAPIAHAQTSPAQTDTKVTITPVTFSLTANAGDTLNNVIKVRNDSAQTQQITMEALNFAAVGEEGQVTLTDDSDSFSLASWIQIDNPTFNLTAGQDRNVSFVIRVPFNAEPGGHYASVYAHIGPPQAQGQSGAAVGQKVGSLILLRVAGEITESASIDSVDTSVEYATGILDFTKKVNFDIRVKNTGTVHVRPKGFVAVNDIFGNKVADVQVEEKNVLPDAVRRLEAIWDKPPLMGRYTANTLLLYGENNQQMTSSVTFWIFPLKLMAVAGAVLLIVLLTLWFGRKRIGKSMSALVGK